MKFTHVDTILLVQDLEASKSFYSGTLGLEVLHDWNSMVVYRERFAILQESELLPREETKRFLKPGRQGRGNVVVYFQCDDLEGCFNMLRNNGVEILHGILPLTWERIFRIYDPDGYVLEIGEPHKSDA